MYRNHTFFITLVFAAFGCTNHVVAWVQFQKVFEELYVKDSENEEFQKTCKSSKTRCLVCHQGKKKKNLNVYGVQVGKFLGKDDRRDVEKISDALEKVSELPFDEEIEQGETFGMRIAKGRLPGGDLDEVMQEPPSESESESSSGTAAEETNSPETSSETESDP